MDVLFFSTSRMIDSGKSEVLLQDVRLDETDRQEIASFEDLAKADFEKQFTTSSTGAAAISTSLMTDITPDTNRQNTMCRISYGGTIGKDYGSRGGFSYASWLCGLNGFDARPFQYLSFKIRGDKGGETPNFYLSDGNKRVCLRAKEVKPLTTDWQEIRLPLSFFGQNGIDLSHLDSLQLTFEWNEQSGTVYVDDIRFGVEPVRGSLSAENSQGKQP
jgi:hypothetical protein